MPFISSRIESLTNSILLLEAEWMMISKFSILIFSLFWGISFVLSTIKPPKVIYESDSGIFRLYFWLINSTSNLPENKYTFSSIISSIIPPTSGDILYQEKSIYKNLINYRNIIF